MQDAAIAARLVAGTRKEWQAALGHSGKQVQRVPGVKAAETAGIRP